MESSLPSLYCIPSLSPHAVLNTSPFSARSELVAILYHSQHLIYSVSSFQVLPIGSHLLIPSTLVKKTEDGQQGTPGEWWQTDYTSPSAFSYPISRYQVRALRQNHSLLKKKVSRRRPSELASKCLSQNLKRNFFMVAQQ